MTTSPTSAERTVHCGCFGRMRATRPPRGGGGGGYGGYGACGGGCRRRWNRRTSSGGAGPLTGRGGEITR